jgi:hypothetical protein
MASPCTGSPRRARLNGRRAAAWAALGLGWLLPSVGCQVEYAGMTLPSGKYMRDDVQYFAPGPAFPWANTQAATQRARMQAMGIEVPQAGAGPLIVPTPPGAIPPVQNIGRPTDTGGSPLNQEIPLAPPNEGAAPPPAPGEVPAPGGAPGAVPPPGGAGGMPQP